MEMEAAREIVIEKLRDAIIAARRRKRRAAIANAIVKLEVAASREGRAPSRGPKCDNRIDRNL
jgi:hypothetical protein